MTIRDARFKLTDDDVAEIRARYAEGGVSQEALSWKYDISQKHVSDLIKGKYRK